MGALTLDDLLRERRDFVRGHIVDLVEPSTAELYAVIEMDQPYNLFGRSFAAVTTGEDWNITSVLGGTLITATNFDFEPIKPRGDRLFLVPVLPRSGTFGLDGRGPWTWDYETLHTAFHAGPLREVVAALDPVDDLATFDLLIKYLPV